MLLSSGEEGVELSLYCAKKCNKKQTKHNCVILLLFILTLPSGPYLKWNLHQVLNILINWNIELFKYPGKGKVVKADIW